MLVIEMNSLLRQALVLLAQAMPHSFVSLSKIDSLAL